jgi:large conductance mechanosensitive channel
MLEGFKEFIMKGNVLDLAVAVIMGGAFGPIVTSMVGDIIMPPVGLAMGKVDFKDLFINLSDKPAANLAAAKAAGIPVIAYGQFMNTVINFLIIAFCVYLIVQAANRMKKEEPAPAAAPTTKDCPLCCTSIPIKAVKCPSCTGDLRTAAGA